MEVTDSKEGVGLHAAPHSCFMGVTWQSLLVRIAGSWILAVRLCNEAVCNPVSTPLLYRCPSPSISQCTLLKSAFWTTCLTGRAPRLLLTSPRLRSMFSLLHYIALDTIKLIVPRSARSAGSAPSNLASASTVLGVHCTSPRIRSMFSLLHYIALHSAPQCFAVLHQTLSVHVQCWEYDVHCWIRTVLDAKSLISPHTRLSIKCSQVLWWNECKVGRGQI